MKKIVYGLMVLGLMQGAAMDARPEVAPPPPHHIPPRRDVGCMEKIKVLDDVLLLMQKRLALMHEVARWKWHSGEPVESPEKELKMIERLADKAEEHGIPYNWACSFLLAQLEAGKEVQYHDFEIWSREGKEPQEPASDLETEIRPYLAKLSFELLVKISTIHHHMIEKSNGCMKIQPQLSKRPEDHLPPHIWNMATRPLRQAACPQPLKGE